MWWIWRADDTLQVLQGSDYVLDKTKISFNASIVLKYQGTEYETVTLLRERGDEKQPSLYLRRPNRQHYSIPLLKSNLQKAVRRGKVEAALASTAALLYQSPSELLRRLPIVLIEDVCLVHGFDGVVWLMVAVSKGYQLLPSDLFFIMQTVHRAAAFPGLCQQENKIASIKTFDELVAGVNKNHKETSFLLAVLVRIAYGGMPGDMALLFRTASWCLMDPGCSHIAESEALILSSGVYQWMLDRDMHKTEQLPASVDFHCTNVLRTLDRIVSHDITQDVVRKTMWIHQSSFNFRKPEALPLAPIWWTKSALPWLEKNWSKYWKPLSFLQEPLVKKQKQYPKLKLTRMSATSNPSPLLPKVDDTLDTLGSAVPEHRAGT